MNLIEKIKRDKRIRKTKMTIIGIIFAAILFGCAWGYYTHETHEIVKVYSVTTQQNQYGSNGSFTTDYDYYVSTDKGVFEISPDGILHSHAFGTIKEGETYEIYCRGYKIAILGIYPHIIDAFPQ